MTSNNVSLGNVTDSSISIGGKSKKHDVIDTLQRVANDYASYSGMLRAMLESLNGISQIGDDAIALAEMRAYLAGNRERWRANPYAGS